MIVLSAQYQCAQPVIPGTNIQGKKEKTGKCQDEASANDHWCALRNCGAASAWVLSQERWK
jgi:hypothetical protein